MDEENENQKKNEDQEDTISNDIVAFKDVTDLLRYFVKNTYKPKDKDFYLETVMNKSIRLFKSDYEVSLLHNDNGELSTNYPSQMPLLKNVTNRWMDNIIYEATVDEAEYCRLVYESKASFARCRTRFPVPVIFYKGKYICRSSTISGGPEMFGRLGYNLIFNTIEGVSNFCSDIYNEHRGLDIDLLKSVNVGIIVDLMVEKKKVKCGVPVTSSEKVDEENRYKEFNIISLPYPGCEFFKNYRENNYTANNLVFDWTQSFVDADLFVPEDPITSQLGIPWEEYKTWDLLCLTQNYLKLILKHFGEGYSGILVHCISGWDRTPLFISLLRLSLWADGVIHQSLDAQQILYLTIAYDWVLFGHHLSDRLAKGEVIFYFAFDMLKHIVSEDYSINQAKNKNKNEKSSRVTNLGEADSFLATFIEDTDSSASNGSPKSASSSNSTNPQPCNPNSDEELLEINSQNGNVLNTNPSSRSPKSLKSSTSKSTSPVSVPGSKSRQRHDSGSSGNSWAFITTTGSVRDSSEIDTNGLNMNGNGMHDAANNYDNDPGTENCSERRSRLLKVRELFIRSYDKSVGFRYIMNEDCTNTGVSGLLGNIISWGKSK